MFSEKQLQELLSLDLDTKILSLYLDVDSTQESIETIKLRVRGMLKDSQLGQEKGATAIEKYLDHSYDWAKPGLALFCSIEGDFFQVFPSAVPFRNRLRVGHKPYVKPLTHLLDHYAHYGVIVVDRVGARFFEFHLGELQAKDGFMGEDVRKLKKGGGSSAVGMRGGVGGSRREEEAVQRNLREAADTANQFFAKKPIRRLFVGGTAETVAQFRDMLPKKLQSSIAGTFAIDMNAGEHEIGDLSLHLLQKANEQREKKLIDQMINQHAKGGNAVISLDDTLQAVNDKRVQTLIISDGYREPGYVHEESGFVISNLTKSPLSDKELIEVDDVIEAAVAQTLSQGGYVEIVSENPALEEAGRIGAILRF